MIHRTINNYYFLLKDNCFGLCLTPRSESPAYQVTEIAPSRPTKPLLRALAGEPMARPPFWFMRQAGRYLPEYRKIRACAGQFLDLCYNPTLATEVSLQPVTRFGVDGAILFSDILVVPDALGQAVDFRQGEGPVLPRRTPEDGLTGLDATRLRRHLAPVYEAVSEIAARVPAETAVIGFAGAPWTVATYMVEGGSSRDFARTKMWAYGDPEGFGALIALLVEATTDHLCAQIEAGAEIVQLFDSWAGVLPEAALARWCLAPVVEIAKRVAAAHPTVPIIAFPRGVGIGYAAFAEAGAVTALSLDTTVPLAWARESLQTRLPVQGNLDPIALRIGGDVMISQTQRILEILGDGALVFNLGHGVVPETPPDHVAALADYLRDWRR